MPKTFQIIDKDQLKEFNYTQEGTAKLKTAIGELDTVIVDQSAHRQQSHSAHVVRAVTGIRTGAGRAHPRRQIGVRDAHQELRSRDAGRAASLRLP